MGAILLLFGLAAADALRGFAARRADGSARTSTRGEPRDTPVVRFPRVRAEGSLVFTDARDCRVREVVLSGGTEFRLPRIFGNCELSVPPFGARIAYGVGRAVDHTVHFRLFDLNHPGESFGGHLALAGFLAWSLDGQRIAWCGVSRKGVDFEFYGDARRLDACPKAYTLENEVAHVQGGRVVAGGKTILRARGAISHVSFGYDGSAAILVGGRIERYTGARLEHAREIPAGLEGVAPIMSPDNCAALFRADGGVRLLNVGCFDGREEVFPGHDGDWSPDGEWVVIAGEEEVSFHRLVGDREEIRWEVAAAKLGWRTRVPPRLHFSHR